MRLSSSGRPLALGLPRVRRVRRELARVGFLCSLAAAGGCSVAAQDDNVESVGSTRALLQIQRIDNGDGSSRGDALAGFVRQASAGAEALENPAGFQRELPEVGRCTTGHADESPLAHPESTRLELLDAESVQLLTSLGTHELAPHAFPTITEWVGGVVHASRDRDAENLPAGDTYRLVARNIQDTGSLDLAFPSPVMPSEVTVDGVAWSEAATLKSADSFIDFTWSRDGADVSDRMLIVVEAEGKSLQCTFNDLDGNGAVPLLGNADFSPPEPGSAARVSLHRIREHTSVGNREVRLIAIRFDFSLATELTFE